MPYTLPEIAGRAAAERSRLWNLRRADYRRESDFQRALTMRRRELAKWERRLARALELEQQTQARPAGEKPAGRMTTEGVNFDDRTAV